jgi:hypothetical protein
LEGSGQWATKEFIGKQLGGVGSFLQGKTLLHSAALFLVHLNGNSNAMDKENGGTFGFEIRDANQKSLQKQPTFQEPCTALLQPRRTGDLDHRPESTKQSNPQSSGRALPTQFSACSTSNLMKPPSRQINTIKS